MQSVRFVRDAVVRVQVALNACSCGAPQLLCAHMLWARLWIEAQTGRTFPVSGADWLLFTPPSASHAASVSSAQPRALLPLPAVLLLRPAEAAADASLSAASVVLLLPHVSESDMAALAQASARLAQAALASAQRARFGSGLSYSGASRIMRGGLRTAAEIADEATHSRILIDEQPQRAVDMLALALRFDNAVRVTTLSTEAMPLELPGDPSAATYSTAVAHAAHNRMPFAMTTLLQRSSAGGGLGVASASTVGARAARSATSSGSAAGDDGADDVQRAAVTVADDIEMDDASMGGGASAGGGGGAAVGVEGSANFGASASAHTGADAGVGAGADEGGAGAAAGVGRGASAGAGEGASAGAKRRWPYDALAEPCGYCGASAAGARQWASQRLRPSSPVGFICAPCDRIHPCTCTPRNEAACESCVHLAMRGRSSD